MPQRLRSVAIIALAVLSFAAPAAAQTGRATGIVRDQAGKPIRGAIVRADNPAAYPPKVTSSSDDRGRWAMIGLASGEWRFTAEAPGYIAQSTSAGVRSAPPPRRSVLLPPHPRAGPRALDHDNLQQG